MKSVSTWTLEGLSCDDLVVLDKFEVWRLVEAQHQVATTSIVDNWQEQHLLEEILEDTKPPIPDDARDLDFLRMTPFRYRPAKGVSPNDKGSRFREAGSIGGAFYAAQDVETAAFESAFYRSLFFSESPGLVLPKNALSYTAFASSISTSKALDLTNHPELSKFGHLWENPDDYRECQRLAKEARNAGVEAIVYKSVRDPSSRKNIVVLTPEAFSQEQPTKQQTWNILCDRNGMKMACELPQTRLALSFADLLAMGDSRFRGMHFA